MIKIEIELTDDQAVPVFALMKKLDAKDIATLWKRSLAFIDVAVGFEEEGGAVIFQSANGRQETLRVTEIIGKTVIPFPPSI